jgi:hypothetical protein
MPLLGTRTADGTLKEHFSALLFMGTEIGLWTAFGI